MDIAADLSLNGLLDPEVLADPYPLYRRLRTEAPVHWDPYLHAWIITRHADVVRVLTTFSAARTPTPERLAGLGMGRLVPFAEVMIRQMLFLDPPDHTRIRSGIATAFTPRRIEGLRRRIAAAADDLLDRWVGRNDVDLLAEFAEPLPSVVLCDLLGLPDTDHDRLKTWSADFAEMLGNFQHNPGRAEHLLASLEEACTYFADAITRLSDDPADGLISSLAQSSAAGQLSRDELIANLLLTLVGGQETTTNLLGNGMLTLLRSPELFDSLQRRPEHITSAVEELLRFESPSQHTARIVPDDCVVRGQTLRKGQAVIAVMGAANRDSAVFSDPDTLDLTRRDNRHLAFGWSAHFCFGAGLARVEAQEAFRALLRRFPRMRLAGGPIEWRANLGLRGLTKLAVRPGG